MTWWQHALFVVGVVCALGVYFLPRWFVERASERLEQAERALAQTNQKLARLRSELAQRERDYNEHFPGRCLACDLEAAGEHGTSAQHRCGQRQRP